MLGRRATVFLTLIALAVVDIAPADAVSSFKGRFSGRGNDCVYPNRAGDEAILENRETMPADPRNPALADFNRSCSCPANDYTTQLAEPAVLACAFGLLVTRKAARCACVKKPAARAATDIKVIRLSSGMSYTQGSMPEGGGGYRMGSNACPGGYGLAGTFATSRVGKKCLREACGDYQMTYSTDVYAICVLER